MLEHRKDCPTRWGLIKRWWKIRQHRKGLNFSTVLYHGVMNHSEWRYKVRDSGWMWGNFKTEQEAIDAGMRHFALVWKYGNDFGVPCDDLCNCFDPCDDE